MDPSLADQPPAKRPKKVRTPEQIEADKIRMANLRAIKKANKANAAASQASAGPPYTQDPNAEEEPIVTTMPKTPAKRRVVRPTAVAPQPLPQAPQPPRGGKGLMSFKAPAAPRQRVAAPPPPQQEEEEYEDDGGDDQDYHALQEVVGDLVNRHILSRFG